MSKAEQILGQALRLPTNEREHLAEELFASLGDSISDTVDEEVFAVLEERRREYLAGRMSTVDADQVLKEAGNVVG